MHVAAEREVPAAAHEEAREAANRKTRRDRPRVQCHRFRKIPLEVQHVGPALAVVVLAAGGAVALVRIPREVQPETLLAEPPPSLGIGPALAEFHHVMPALAGVVVAVWGGATAKEGAEAHLPGTLAEHVARPAGQ